MSDRVVEIVVLVGSLRKASVNRRLAQVAAENAPAGVVVTVLEKLDSLPFYSEDSDQATPDEPVDLAVARLRTAVGAADGVLIVTPEYNGSIPAVLKNAIDWLSRPYGSGAMQAKPVGVIGAALGRFAGTWSRQDTRKSVGIAGGRVIEDIEVGLQSSELTAAGPADPAVVEQVVGAVRRLVDEVAVSA